jgi:hypothetical protein
MTLSICVIMAFAILPLASAQTPSHSSAQGGPPVDAAPAHVVNSFHFQVKSSFSEAAVLFGPEAERRWAGPHWNPAFLHPQPGVNSNFDTQGAVFTVQHGTQKSIWVNTLFDLAEGRMQYVAFIPDHMVSTVDVRLNAIDPHTTGVDVTYIRTALTPEANADVEAQGRKDRDSGPEWQQAIEDWQSHRKTP